MQKQSLFRTLLAEFIGSTFLMIVAISPVILFTSVLGSHPGLAVLANAIAVAFVLCTLIELFAPISGAHFNPVVTMVMAFERKLSPQKALLFILLQIIGGIVGLILIHLMFFDEIGGVFFLSDIQRSGGAYLAELLGTFILIFAILMLARAKSNRASMMVALLVGGQILATSSTMFANPQITLARMFTNSIAGIRPLDGMVFIAMQIAGALLAYGVYRILFAGTQNNV